MIPTPARIALLHLARDFPPDQVALISRNYREKVARFDAEVRASVPREQERAWRYYNASLQGSWKWLAYYGREVVLWVVETRSFPAGKAKAVELAARLFPSGSSARPPRDVPAWWEKNAKHALLLVEALDWPEKKEAPLGEGVGGVQEKFAVGPFMMHNTLHLEGDKLASTVALLEAASQKIRGASPGSLADVLYGDVLVVGRIRQANKLAWYFIADDTLYLRPHLKVGRGELHNLIHELGHRYWYKSLSSTAQREWNTTYYLMKNTQSPRVKTPQVGDTIDISFKGRDEPPVVEAIVPGRGGLSYKLVGGGFVSTMVVYKALLSQAIAAKFPTPYAATSAEEYFAEAFALHVLGTLPEAHEAKFSEVVR